MRYQAAAGLVFWGLLSGCQTVPSTDSSTSKARAAPGLTPSGQPFKPFPVYTDRPPRHGHYVPSGYMGDSDLSLSGAFIRTPTDDGPAIKVVYKADGPKGWSGLYWQDPANNWGDVGGRSGYDLRGATKLTFWARGEHGGEKIHEFRVGGLVGRYPDSDVTTISNIRLGKEWKRYVIDLAGKDLRHIIGGFGFSLVKAENPRGIVFYLDDIFYEGLEPPAMTRSTPEHAESKIPGLTVAESSASVSVAAPTAVPLPTVEDLEVKKVEEGLRVSFSSQFLFAPGQALLGSGSNKILDQLVELLSAYPSNPVLMEGHTDGTGNSDFNLRLSQRRAEAIRDYLIKKGGYEASRFRVVGYGATRPIADNATKAGRARNRRVEVTILKMGAE